LNTRVNQNITYQHYTQWDLRYLPDGGDGNCTTIAYTKWRELQRLGYGRNAKMRLCELWDGQWHAFVVVSDTWALDNINPRVLPVQDVGCRRGVFDLNDRIIYRIQNPLKEN
jgi:predicted transglutaminase-like cysteine proteinase